MTVAALGAPVIAGLAIGVVFVALFSMSMQRSFIPDTRPAIDLPKDTGSQMPPDFAVVYSTSRASPVLDTRNSLATKDMVCDRDIQVKLVLSSQELERIWQSAIDNEFFRIPSDLTTKCDYYQQCGLLFPSHSSNLNITAFGQSHYVEYSNAKLPSAYDRHIEGYENMVSTIQSLLQGQEELEQLPKPRCGYQ